MKLSKEWIELHIGFEQSGNKNKIIMTDFPIIKTNRLLLRQFIKSDVENVYKGLSHSDVIKYYGISFDSLEATEEQMHWFADLVRNKTGIWWAICSSDNTTFLRCRRS